MNAGGDDETFFRGTYRARQRLVVVRVRQDGLQVAEPAGPGWANLFSGGKKRELEVNGDM